MSSVCVLESLFSRQNLNPNLMHPENGTSNSRLSVLLKRSGVIDPSSQMIMQILRESQRLYGRNAPVYIEITKGMYTLSQLELLLGHLRREDWRPAPIPDSFDARDKNSNNSQSKHLRQAFLDEEIRCSNLYHLISQSLVYIVDLCPAQLRQQTVDQLCSHLDDILSACIFVLQSRNKHRPEEWYYAMQLSAALDTLSAFDIGLKRQMRSSHKFVRFLLSTWCGNPRQKNCPFIAYDMTTEVRGGRSCSIAGHLRDCLADDDFSTIAFDLLVNHPDATKLRARLIKATILRCEYYASLEKGDVEKELRGDGNLPKIEDSHMHTPVGAVFGMLKQIVALVQGFSKLPTLSQGFLESDYVDYLFDAMRSWILEKSSRREKDRPGRERAIFVLSGLQNWLESQSRVGRAHWKAVNESYGVLILDGYLGVLQELLRSVRGGPRNGPFGTLTRCAYLLKRRCGMQSFNMFGGDLAEALAEVCPDDDKIQELGGRADKDCEYVWASVVTDLWAADSEDVIGCLNICNNMKVCLPVQHTSKIGLYLDSAPEIARLP